MSERARDPIVTLARELRSDGRPTLGTAVRLADAAAWCQAWQDTDDWRALVELLVRAADPRAGDAVAALFGACGAHVARTDVVRWMSYLRQSRGELACGRVPTWLHNVFELLARKTLPAAWTLCAAIRRDAPAPPPFADLVR